MMQGLRQERDADRIDMRRTTEIKTDEYQHELFCGICNKRLFVDSQTLDSVNRAVAEGLDNPLLCDNCIAEYEDLAHPPV